MENVIIRPVTPADYPALLEVYRQCEDFISLGPVAKASMNMVLQDIRETKAERGIFCRVLSGTQMIGVVSYIPSSFEFRPVDAFILLLMLIPSHRSKGAGSTIVDRIEKECQSHGKVRSICCGVQVNNPAAIRFWEKKGYYKYAGPELRPDKTTVYRLRKDINRGGKSSG
jgi:ribosomal protein S18 acetylase RimI-like enzyme